MRVGRFMVILLFLAPFLMVITIDASSFHLEELMDRLSLNAHEESENEIERQRRPASVFVLKDPSYLILVPRMVRAGHPYRLVVNILPPSPSLVVMATLFRDNIQVDLVEKECHKEEPNIFQIMVPPSTSASGRYKLRLEGNEVGCLTGSSFTNETHLVFSPRGLTVLIQLERKLYNLGDTIRFRIITLDGTIGLTQDPVDIFALSPRGVLVKKWPSKQCREGAISIKFPLSEEAEIGRWKIRVEATNSFAEQIFVVEDYRRPLFQVNVRLPPFVPSSQSFLEGSVSATYSSGAPVAGTMMLTATLKPLDKNNVPYYRTNPIVLHEGVKFSDVHNFRYQLDDLQTLLAWPTELEIRIAATVGDAFLGASNVGFGTVRVFKSEVLLKFIGDSPFIIRPSMPFEYHLSASLPDGSHVPSDLLRHHRLRVSSEVRLRSGQTQPLAIRDLPMTRDHYALWRDDFDLSSQMDPERSHEIESLTLKAELKDASGRKAYSTLVAVPQHTTRGRHLQVSTSSKDPKVGEFLILHVRTNFYVQKFRYLVVSKGIIITAGQENMEASLKTFPLALTPDMAGSATMVVYALVRGEAVVADALTYPVDALTKLPLAVALREDAAKGRIHVVIRGEPGSRVSLTGLHSEQFRMQRGDGLSQSKIAKQMMEDSRTVSHPWLRSPEWLYQEPLNFKWSLDGGMVDEVVYLPRGSFGSDANHTFEAVGLSILADSGVPVRGNTCPPNRGLHPCLTGGCYVSSSSCDGKLDCTDRIDEKGCFQRENDLEENLSNFYLHRQSRISMHYTPAWLWADLVLGPDGTGSLSVTSPEKPSDLVLSAFALHPSYGMSLVTQPAKIETCPPYWLWVEAPERVGVWEQVGIRVTLVNKLEDDLPAVVVLANNPVYRFVSLEDFDRAQPFPADSSNRSTERAPVRRILSGEHEYSLTIAAGGTRTIHLPIVPVMTGNVKIIVQASIPGAKLSRTTNMIVEPMGAAQKHHTSLLLDLSSRSYLFTFLDVVQPQHFEVDLASEAQLSLFGGVVGSGSEDITSSMHSLNLPEVGAEPVAFSILMSVLQLNHWQEMDQNPAKNEKEIFGRISLLYQTLLSYQNVDGGFRYFKTNPMSSVWVTSLVLRALAEASTRWQKLLYIDPQVTDRAIRFVMRHQARNGAFGEPSGNVGVRHLKAMSAFSQGVLSAEGLNLSSTALTVIQLLSLKELPEPLDREVSKTISRSLHWLEMNLKSVAKSSNPFEVALVALVLHLLNSSKKEDAFAILARNARQKVKYVYWGESPVLLPMYRVESHRPHLLPRSFNQHDSGNVAATACALRVYAARGELLTPAIVKWLHSQRTHQEGWMSTLDTLLAWEALYDFSSRQNSAKFTHLTVTAETLGSLVHHQHSRVFYVTSDNLLHLQQENLGDVEGSVRIQGKGNGSAVLQLTTTHYISNARNLKSPPHKAFLLGTRAVASGTNASSLTFSSCVRWIYTTVAPTSGIAVLQVSIPTGYGVYEKELQRYVRMKRVPHLRRMKVEARQVAFYFEKLGPANTCVEFSVHRWFPVANLTKVLLARVYEFYSPELFAVELLDMSSITLDICQVCGSYQCPNCPILSYYSSGSKRTSTSRGRSLYEILCGLIWSYLLVVYF